MRVKYSLFMLLLIGLFLTGLYEVPVKAGTQVDVGVDYFTSGTHSTSVSHKSNIQGALYNRCLVHSSGKTVIAQKTGASSHPTILVMSSTGAILAQSDISAVLTNYNYGMSMVEYDATSVIIFGASDTTVQCVKYNINTYTASALDTVGTGCSGASGNDYFSNIIKWGEDFYVFNYYYGYSSGTGMGMLQFDTSATNLLWADSEAFSHQGNVIPPQLVLDDTLDKIYCLLYTTTTSTMMLYEFDLNTNVESKICDAPSSGGYFTYDEYATENSANKYTPIEFRITKDPATGYYYITYIGVTSHKTGAVGVNGVMYAELTTWITEYSATPGSGTLTNSAKWTNTELDTSGNAVGNSGQSWGYIEYKDPDYLEPTVTIIYSDVVGGLYPRNLSVKAFQLDSIADHDTAYDRSEQLSDIGVSGIYTYCGAQSALIWKDNGTGVSYQVTYAHSYYYYGEAILAVVYGSDITIYPVDEPMLTGKTYIVTYTVYRNNVLTNDELVFRVAVDGVQQTNISGNTTLINGVATFNLKVLSPGGHTIALLLFENGENVYYSSDTGLVFVAPDIPDDGIPEGDTISSGSMAMVISFIIPAAVLIFPTGIVLGVTMNHLNPVVGLMIGLTLGGVLGVYIQAFDLYVLLLIVLIDVLMLVFMRPSSPPV